MKKNDIIDFGLQPVSKRFIKDPNEDIPFFKLEIY